MKELFIFIIIIFSVILFFYSMEMMKLKEIFVDDSSKRLRYSAGKLIVRNPEGKNDLEISLDQIDTLNIIGNPQISTQLLKAMSVRKKPFIFIQIMENIFQVFILRMKKIMKSSGFNLRQQTI